MGRDRWKWYSPMIFANAHLATSHHVRVHLGRAVGPSDLVKSSHFRFPSRSLKNSLNLKPDPETALQALPSSIVMCQYRPFQS